MSQVTETRLSLEQLRELANEPEAARAQLEALLMSLKCSDEHIQWACEALENCGQPHTTSLALLMQLVDHSNVLIATWACKLLARLGSDAQAAQSQLACAVSTRREEVLREEAARALGQLAELSAASRAALQDAAIHGGPRLKRLATASLGG